MAALSELSLDSLLDMPVTGASRFMQRRSQASSAVTVITRQEIAAFGHRTLADVLRSVRGTVIATDRTYDYLGVRGFMASGDYNTRVLLLVDGNRINDALYDQAFIGAEFPLDLDLVERVEFVPGQGSAVYGANALFGIVNVVTREAPRQAQAALGTGLASAGERVLRGHWRHPWPEGGLQVQASRTLVRGDPVFDAGQAAQGTHDGWSRGTDTTRRSAAYLRLDHGGFTGSLMHADRLKGTPLAVDVIFGDTRNRYRDSYSLINLERAFVLDEHTRATARLFAGRYRFTGDYAIDYPPPTMNRDIAVASWRGVEARVERAFDTGHHVVAGVELQDAPTLLQRNFDIEPSQDSYLDDRRRAWRASLYAEAQWALAEAWELHLGARLDRHRGGAWHASPRAALVWTPQPAWSLKLIQGQAFRPPNAFEASYAVDAPGGYRINPALGAETVRGTELVAEWRPDLDWRLSGSLYRSHARRLLVLGYDDEADRYEFDNAMSLDMRGGEFEIEFARAGLRWRANASWSRNAGPGAALSTYPTRMFKSTALVPLVHDWTAGVEFVGVARRGSAPGHGLLNVSAHGRWPGGGPLLTLSLRNLTDRSAYDAGADPQRQPRVPLPGRSWRIEASWPLAY